MVETCLHTPNIGPNRGRLLARPIKGFVHRLLATVAKTTGLSYRELDKELGYPPATDSITESYVKLSHKGRAAQASGVQDLENKVARFLGRPAFQVVVRNLGVGPSLIRLSGNLDPVGLVADYKPPRASKTSADWPFDPRGFVLVGYELMHDEFFMGFGKNFLPSALDIDVYRAQIANFASQHPTTHPLHQRAQELVAARSGFLDELVRSCAGKLPEHSAFFV